MLTLKESCLMVVGRLVVVDRLPARKIFVAVEERGCSIQSVTGVVNSWTLRKENKKFKSTRMDTIIKLKLSSSWLSVSNAIGKLTKLGPIQQVQVVECYNNTFEIPTKAHEQENVALRECYRLQVGITDHTGVTDHWQSCCFL